MFIYSKPQKVAFVNRYPARLNCYLKVFNLAKNHVRNYNKSNHENTNEENILWQQLIMTGWTP